MEVIASTSLWRRGSPSILRVEPRPDLLLVGLEERLDLPQKSHPVGVGLPLQCLGVRPSLTDQARCQRLDLLTLASGEVEGELQSLHQEPRPGPGGGLSLERRDDLPLPPHSLQDKAADDPQEIDADETQDDANFPLIHSPTPSHKSASIQSRERRM